MLIRVCLASASARYQLWDVKNRTLLRRLDGHYAYVKDLLFLDNHTLASASADQTVRLWDLSDLDSVPESRVLRGHEDEVTSLALLPDRKTLVTGCRDGTVFLWDTSVPPRREVSHFSFSPRGEWVITPDKKSMITCGWDGSVARRTGSRYEIGHALFHAGLGFGRGGISDDGTKLAAAYDDGTVKIWNVEQQKVIQQFETQVGPVRQVEFLSDDDKLLVIGRDNLSVWDWSRNELLQRWPHSGQFQILSPLGNACLEFSADGTMVLSERPNGKKEPLPPSWRAGGSNCFSVDGRYLASSTYPSDRTGASHTGEINVWDLSMRTKVGSYGRFLMSAHGVAFSPDGKRLVGGSGSFEAIKLWDFESQQEVLTLEADGGPLSGVRFSGGGDILAANNEGGVVFCWCAPSWAEIEAAEAEQQH